MITTSNIDLIKMVEINPFEIFEFKTTERDIYTLLIQLTKVSPQKYNKIKAADLVQLSNYSRTKVYEAIKRLNDLKLLQIDGYRPMVIKPLDPKFAIEKLTNNKKRVIENAGKLLIDELYELPKINPIYPLNETAPVSFFSGLDKYFIRLESLFNQAKQKIILICGFLIKNEEILLKEYLRKKLETNPRIEIRILYGGSFYDIGKTENKRFRSHFKSTIINPNKELFEKFAKRIFIDGAIINPPLRITLIDDSELIMALKFDEKQDIRIGITDLSGIQSSNTALVRFVNDTYIMLKKIFIDIIKNVEDFKKLIPS